MKLVTNQKPVFKRIEQNDHQISNVIKIKTDGNQQNVIHKQIQPQVQSIHHSIVNKQAAIKLHTKEEDELYDGVPQNIQKEPFKLYQPVFRRKPFVPEPDSPVVVKSASPQMQQSNSSQAQNQVKRRNVEQYDSDLKTSPYPLSSANQYIPPVPVYMDSLSAIPDRNVNQIPAIPPHQQQPIFTSPPNLEADDPDLAMPEHGFPAPILPTPARNSNASILKFEPSATSAPSLTSCLQDSPQKPARPANLGWDFGAQKQPLFDRNQYQHKKQSLELSEAPTSEVPIFSQNSPPIPVVQKFAKVTVPKNAKNGANAPYSHQNHQNQAHNLTKPCDLALEDENVARIDHLLNKIESLESKLAANVEIQKATQQNPTAAIDALLATRSTEIQSMNDRTYKFADQTAEMAKEIQELNNQLEIKTRENEELKNKKILELERQLEEAKRVQVSQQVFQKNTEGRSVQMTENRASWRLKQEEMEVQDNLDELVEQTLQAPPQPPKQQLTQKQQISKNSKQQQRQQLVRKEPSLTQQVAYRPSNMVDPYSQQGANAVPGSRILEVRNAAAKNKVPYYKDDDFNLDCFVSNVMNNFDREFNIKAQRMNPIITKQQSKDPNIPIRGDKPGKQQLTRKVKELQVEIGVDQDVEYLENLNLHFMAQLQAFD